MQNCERYVILVLLLFCVSLLFVDTCTLYVPKYVTVMPLDARSVTLTSKGPFGEALDAPFDTDLLGFTPGVCKIVGYIC